MNDKGKILDFMVTQGHMDDRDPLKNYKIEHTRHRSFENFINNLLSGLIAYFFFDKKPSFKLDIIDNRLSTSIELTLNINNQAQKAKVSYYNSNGKRTNRFKVPYKNEDGYYSCLFGEHLLGLKENIDKQIVLVESEKTALVCSMEFPDYVWLAYGGKNGLTDIKTKILSGRKIIIIPDISQGAVNVMKAKIPYLRSINIEPKIWDMTEGKTDEQLKKEGIYEYDLEDILKNLV